MLMGKQMILTVLIIPVALGAIPEYQIVSVLLRPSANRAFVDGGLFRPLLHAPGICLSPVYLLRRITAHALHAQEENQEITQRYQRHDRVSRMGNDTCLLQGENHRLRQVGGCEARHYRHAKIYRIENSQPFRLDRNKEEQQKLHIGIGCGKGKK